MKLQPRFLLTILALAPLHAPLQAQKERTPASARAPLRVLFVGNSYTFCNDLPWLVERLAAADPKARAVRSASAVLGGATLEQHWKAGKVLALLGKGRWDYVVLQEQSLRPLLEREKMFAFARKLDKAIRASGARTIFFETWARKGKPTMQEGLDAAYLAITRECKALIAPVGMAWKAALKRHRKLVLHAADGSHPNAAGSYLAACVFHAVLHGRSPLGLGGRIAARNPAQGTPLIALSRSEAAFLQRIAWESARRYAKKR